MLVPHHRRNEKCVERPSTGKEKPGAYRKKSFKGCARNKNDLEGNQPLAPFPKKTAQVSLHQTISETELKFRGVPNTAQLVNNRSPGAGNCAHTRAEVTPA